MGRGEARWLSEERGNEQITGCFGPLTRASSCCPEQSCRPAGSSVSPSPHPPHPHEFILVWMLFSYRGTELNSK